MNGLYAIVDVAWLSRRAADPVEFGEAVLEARPAALQIRAKCIEARDILALARALRARCRDAEVPLYINDRPDLASLAGCDGVHIGQTDAPFSIVKRLVPELAVGMSTHTPEQLHAALELRPTYVAYGPIYETASKPDAEPVVGLEGLRHASKQARAAGIPLVAIGGITLERAPDIAPYADAVAVIRDLFPPETNLADVAKRAKEFQRVLRAAREAFSSPHNG